MRRLQLPCPQKLANHEGRHDDAAHAHGGVYDVDNDIKGQDGTADNGEGHNAKDDPVEGRAGLWPW